MKTNKLTLAFILFFGALSYILAENSTTQNKNNSFESGSNITSVQPEFKIKINLDSIVSCYGEFNGVISAKTLDTIFFEGFENYTGTGTHNGSTSNLSGLDGWSFEGATSRSRLRIPAGSNYPHSGNFSATLDVSTSGSTSKNYLIKEINLSEYASNNSPLFLSFWFMHHSDEYNNGDRVWVRGSNTDNWIEVYNWYQNRNTSGNWKDVNINISTFLQSNSQTLSETFQVRFGQEDNFPSTSITSSDGLTIDDISLSTTLTSKSITYLWSNGDTTNSLNGIGAGTYTVTATDTNGNTSTDSIIVNEPTVLSTNTITNSNISCNGAADGAASVLVSGGTTPYSYNWDNGATTAYISGVPAGTYTVTTTDANGCSNMDTVIITEPNIVVASTVTIGPGQAFVKITGGTPPYTYLWNNSSTNDTITVENEGLYSVTVTDANGCIDTSSVYVIVYECPENISYCSSKAYYDFYMWNQEISTALGLVHTTGKSGGYADYKDNFTINTTQNATVEISLTPGYYYWAYHMGWRVYVDWNQNGDFSDAGEMMYSGFGNTTKTGSVTVPNGVSPGCYAVRISTSWGSYPNACGNFTYGEVQDYLLSVEASNGQPKIAQKNTVEETPFNYNFEFAAHQNIIKQGEDILVTLMSRNNGNTNFYVSDALGRRYKTIEINHQEGESITTISTSNLPKGVYFITNPETVKALKVIVQ